MKFCTVEAKDDRGKVSVRGNEVMACVIKVQDDLGLESKKPKRLVSPGDRARYEPRIIFKGKDFPYYVLRGQKHYLNMNEQKEMRKALKKAQKMIKKGELE
jgi:hypothetical protein